ncbi:MAG TPA: hypothetical protein VLR44_07210 [Rhodoferax sp.]|nr:hypothetical protein [Rhodoferax sp.]
MAIDTSKTSDSRRNFFNTAGLIGGAAVAAGAGAIPYTDHGERDKDFPDIKENRVTLPPNGKIVLIVGGGLSELLHEDNRGKRMVLPARPSRGRSKERSVTP